MMNHPYQSPTFFRLIAIAAYEVLLLLALMATITFIFVFFVGDATTGVAHFLLQFTLWVFLGFYFVFCWTKAGQTLAMKTWRVQLIKSNGTLLDFKLAGLRYVLASLSLGFFGAGFVWAIFDREGLFLHDRLLGTKLIKK
jgi:uncharacterized RDD family membrane protein YckC